MLWDTPTCHGMLRLTATVSCIVEAVPTNTRGLCWPHRCCKPAPENTPRRLLPPPIIASTAAALLLPCSGATDWLHSTKGCQDRPPPPPPQHPDTNVIRVAREGGGYHETDQKNVKSTEQALQRLFASAPGTELGARPWPLLLSASKCPPCPHEGRSAGHTDAYKDMLKATPQYVG
jgi:hypothetical protein